MKKNLTFLIAFSFLILSFPLITEGEVDMSLITQKLNKLINVAFTICLLLAVIMFIIAGIVFLTAAGSPQQLGKAKSAFIYGVIGVVLAVLAKTIVHVLETL